jgi:hypothetical protein
MTSGKLTLKDMSGELFVKPIPTPTLVTYSGLTLQPVLIEKVPEV